MTIDIGDRPYVLTLLGGRNEVLFQVTPLDSPASHNVSWHPPINRRPGYWTCDCGHFTWRCDPPEQCKHIAAVRSACPGPRPLSDQSLQSTSGIAD